MEGNRSTNHMDSLHIICILLVWIVMIYSSIIQQKYFKLPNAMLVLGIGIIIFYILGFREGALPIEDLFPRECFWMIGFMVYMLLVGTLVAPNKSSHMTQWIQGFEFLLIMMVISSLIKKTGTELFHALLLFISIALAVIFISNPVYHSNGRYSLSLYMNSNGLGMSFSAGIWAGLYYQLKEKIPTTISAIIVGIFGYCIILTGSRKSLISAAVILLLWLVFCYLPSLMEKGAGNAIIKFLLIFTLVLVIGSRLYSLYTGSTMAFRMGFLQEEATTGTRNAFYQIGWLLFKQHPLFGIGFRGFQYYYGSYSHATLVEIPVSGGILGSLIYFGTFFLSIKKCVGLYLRTKLDVRLIEENRSIKMILILWGVMLFYSTCIIHQYQFDSFILFGLIFGQSAYIEERIYHKEAENKEILHKCRWIRY